MLVIFLFACFFTELLDIKVADYSGRTHINDACLQQDF